MNASIKKKEPIFLWFILLIIISFLGFIIEIIAKLKHNIIIIISENFGHIEASFGKLSAILKNKIDINSKNTPIIKSKFIFLFFIISNPLHLYILLTLVLDLLHTFDILLHQYI